MSYDLGDTVPLTTEILDATGALTAASGVVCTIGQPDGTSATPSVGNPSLGRYTVDFVPSMAGRHTERWTSTSPATARTDDFDVRPATPGYVISLADAKRHLNMDATGTSNDEELRDWIEASTNIVERLAGKVTARRTVVETRRIGGYRPAFCLGSVPVISLTSIVDVYGLLTWSVANFDVDPDSGVVNALLHTLPAYGLVRVTYVAGYQVIPAHLTGAAKMIVKHLWDSQRAGISSQQRTRVQSGQQDTIVVNGFAIPRAAVEMVGSPTLGFA